MGVLALPKGTSSFGLARATGTIASADAEALETWAQRVVRDVAVEGFQEEEGKRVEHRGQFDMRHCESCESTVCVVVLEQFGPQLLP